MPSGDKIFRFCPPLGIFVSFFQSDATKNRKKTPLRTARVKKEKNKNERMMQSLDVKIASKVV